MGSRKNSIFVITNIIVTNKMWLQQESPFTPIRETCVGLMIRNTFTPDLS